MSIVGMADNVRWVALLALSHEHCSSTPPELLQTEQPFDAIHVGAAADSLHPELIAALAPNGRMVIPVGPRYSHQVGDAGDAWYWSLGPQVGEMCCCLGCGGWCRALPRMVW